MKLLRLSANQKSFRTVEFNSSGLSLIVGKRSDPFNKDTKKTYNGVGKSLLITLVHFCLASKQIKEFESNLPGWEFSLEFEIGGTQYISRRQTENQNKIVLNGKSKSLEEFGKYFGEKLFFLQKEIPFLKFRPLISRFARKTKQAYSSFDNFVDKENRNPVAPLLCNTYLLGLDPSLVTKKYQLKKKLDETKEQKKQFEKLEGEGFFQGFLVSEKELQTGIRDLGDEIQRLQHQTEELDQNLKTFQVAEDYQEIESRANRLKTEKDQKNNRIVLLEKSIGNIEKSLQKRPDLSPEEVFQFYDQAKMEIPDMLKKNMQEVANFHLELIQNREIRLQKEKEKFLQEKKQLENERLLLGKEMNELIQYLDTHRALDEYHELQNRLNEDKTRLNKLKNYQGLLGQFKNNTENFKDQIKEHDLQTNRYIKEEKLLIDGNIERFRAFSRRFYKNKPGGIIIENNEGDNQLRFNVDVKIEDDTSDGINEVKIFCFDLTLLTQQHNHKIRFLFHDSRLFSDIDFRQRSTLFKLAYENTYDSNAQYIATINEDHLLSIKEFFSEEEYKKIITDNIVLELTDESDTSRLLGVHINMSYEK